MGHVAQFKYESACEARGLRGHAIKFLPFAAAVVIAYHDETAGPLLISLNGDREPRKIPRNWHGLVRPIVLSLLSSTQRASYDALRIQREVLAATRDATTLEIAEERRRLGVVSALVDAGQITTIAELERACRAALAPAEDVA